MKSLRAAIAVLMLSLAAMAPARAENVPAAAMSPAELFALADAARDRGDHVLAEKAYRALAGNPDVELRSEARFRLAMMLADRMNRPRDAAVELRRILDEKPGAAGVRLELARMHARIGNLTAAAREVRAARAAGLPPEVEQLVRFFANALDSRKPFGANLEVALAPDTNVNRATRSETLGTVLGDFVIDPNARARSGIGASLRGQAYLRRPITPSADLLVRASADADLYARSRFDDIQLSVQAGPQIRSGSDRLSVAALVGWRWFGLAPFSFSWGGTANWQHPLGRRGQLRVDGSVLREENRVVAIRSATRYSVATAVERSVSARFGVGGQVTGFREVAGDPAFSLTGGSLTPYAFREIGRTTAVVQLGYQQLRADARAFIYPRKRRDDRLSASLSATFRALTIGTFAPFSRLRIERNRSTVGIFDFNRIAAEFGLTAAF